MKDDYQVNDDVWIFLGNHQGDKSKGKVIKVIDDLPGYIMTHYIIEFDTHIEPILECRNAFTMSPDEHTPIGLWYLVSEMRKNKRDDD